MSTFIIFSPQNIEGGGDDTIIRGNYSTLDEAKKVAQDIVDEETFNEWLNVNIQYPGIPEDVYLLHELSIMEIPTGKPISRQIGSDYRVRAQLGNPLITSHVKYELYKDKFEAHLRRHNIR